LTGDPSILRGAIRPNAEFSTFLGEPQGGISEDDQARIRGLALDALRTYRDGGGRLAPPPSDDTVREMMQFIIGRPLSKDYVDFLLTELALDGADPYATPLGTIPEADRRRFRVVVIGAGMSGLLGTGFQASRFLFPMTVKGRGGLDLHAHWAGDPRAYLGITIPGFPNLFCLYGPNTNIVVNGSIVFFSECEMRYVLGCIDLLLRDGHAAMDCRGAVHDAYNRLIDEGNQRMTWGTPGVRSWYKNARGRVTQNWPFTLLEYWGRTRAPDPADYEFIAPPDPPQPDRRRRPG
jgi:hypothetical protein